MALASLPLYLAVRGAPTDIEVIVFGWLLAPILVSYYLSQTGRYETAHIISFLALATAVMAVSLKTGGVSSFAAIWLVAVPLEAALSASRRVVALAVAVALGCAVVLITAGEFGVLPQASAGIHAGPLLDAFGIGSATIYAAGLAFGAESLARTSAKLLGAEEERYRLLARNIGDVISRHGRNGAVQFISPAAEALLGVPAANLIGYGLFDLVHVADRPAYLTALSDAARSMDGVSVEFRIRRQSPQGGPADFVWIEMRCRPFEWPAVPSNDGEFDVVAVMRDVSERKLQQDAIEAARAEAERADASKSRFLAAMSHELRTPLNAIIGFSEMMTNEQDMMLDATRRKEYATLINESGLHLLSVVNGILDMSKMQSGNFEIMPEMFTPRDAIVSCCNLMALKARENGVDLVCRAPLDLPQIHGDPRAFKQILINLLSNAVKFTERGGSVTLTAHVEGSRLALRITDTGVGINAEDLKRIGDPFFQAGKAYQRRHEGTGLGLSIVKSLVALHDGDMTVRSRIDEGTTVSISLPLNFSSTAKPSKIATLAPVSRPDATTSPVKKIA